MTNRSFIDSHLKEHRDTFIGLGRTAAALRLKPGADERRLMDESFTAGQRAWATSAASALVKMTARLKASDTELGRSIRHLDELNERIQALYQQSTDEGIAQFKNNPALRQGMEAMAVTGAALMKDMAPLMKSQRELAGVTKRQQELASRLNGLAKRCPTASGPGCAASDRERIAIKKELSELSAKTSHAMKEQDLDRMQETARLALEQLAAADKTIPGFADAGKVMEARNDESRRLERELNAAREAVVKRFPEFLSLSEPAPLTVAETQKLLKEDEALVAILTGPESSLVWVVTSRGSDLGGDRGRRGGTCRGGKSASSGPGAGRGRGTAKLRYRPLPRPLPASARPVRAGAGGQEARDACHDGAAQQLALPSPRHRAAAP